MIRLTVLVLMFWALHLPAASAMQAVDFPENAVPRIDRPGWTCSFGYQRIEERCERIALPENAALNINGRGWHCLPEYTREESECTRVNYPANAVLVSARHWKCLKGFRQDGDRCVHIIVPPNAELTFRGKDWRCLDGYRKVGEDCLERSPRATGSPRALASRASGPCPRGLRRERSRCVLFPVPDNAVYDETGNGWICMIGYERQASGCIREAAASTALKEN